MTFKQKGFSLHAGTSPAKAKADEGRKTVKQYATGKKEVKVKGDTRTAAELNALADKAEKDGANDAAQEMRDRASKKISEGKRAQDYLDKTAKKTSPAKQKGTHPEKRKTVDIRPKKGFKELETERIKGDKYIGKRSKGGLKPLTNKDKGKKNPYIKKY